MIRGGIKMFDNFWNGFNNQNDFQQCNQNYMNGYNGGRAITKRYLLDCISTYYGGCEVIQADFEENYTRHICPGSKQVQVLQSFPFNIPTERGNVTVRVIHCNVCGKTIVDRNSLDVI